MKNTIEQDFLLQSNNALHSGVRCAGNASRHEINPEFLGMSIEHQVQPMSALRDVQSQQKAEKSLLERKRLFFSHVMPFGIHMR